MDIIKNNATDPPLDFTVLVFDRHYNTLHSYLAGLNITEHYEQDSYLKRLVQRLAQLGNPAMRAYEMHGGKFLIEVLNGLI